VRACVRACVRARVCACVCVVLCVRGACVRACVHACVRDRNETHLCAPDKFGPTFFSIVFIAAILLNFIQAIDLIKG
jgi:hypothetical protein